MALEFFWSDSVINYRLLLSEYYSLYKFLALLHQCPWEERAVNAIIAPTSHSITDTHTDICDKRCIFTVSPIKFRNWVRSTNKNKLLVLRYKLRRFMSSKSDSLSSWIIIKRCERAQFYVAEVMDWVIALHAWVAVINTISILSSFDSELSTLWILWSFVGSLIIGRS
jgi:hypothetical protein